MAALRWDQKYAKNAAIGLFLWRLTGFAAYEITKARVMFVLFSNLFYTVFAGYLICLKLGKHSWLDRKSSLALFLVILLFTVKLPQEYLLHYAEFKSWMPLKHFFGEKIGG